MGGIPCAVCDIHSGSVGKIADYDREAFQMLTSASLQYTGGTVIFVTFSSHERARQSGIASISQTWLFQAQC